MSVMEDGNGRVSAEDADGLGLTAMKDTLRDVGKGSAVGSLLVLIVKEFESDRRRLIDARGEIAQLRALHEGLAAVIAGFRADHVRTWNELSSTVNENAAASGELSELCKSLSLVVNHNATVSDKLGSNQILMKEAIEALHEICENHNRCLRDLNQQEKQGIFGMSNVKEFVWKGTWSPEEGISPLPPGPPIPPEGEPVEDALSSQPRRYVMTGFNAEGDISEVPFPTEIYEQWKREDEARGSIKISGIVDTEPGRFGEEKSEKDAFIAELRRDRETLGNENQQLRLLLMKIEEAARSADASPLEGDNDDLAGLEPERTPTAREGYNTLSIAYDSQREEIANLRELVNSLEEELSRKNASLEQLDGAYKKLAVENAGLRRTLLDMKEAADDITYEARERNE